MDMTAVSDTGPNPNLLSIPGPPRGLQRGCMDRLLQWVIGKLMGLSTWVRCLVVRILTHQVG